MLHPIAARAARPLAAAFALVLAVPALALAQTVTGFRPDCGAEGDPVLIQGTGFSTASAVTFGGVAAPVVRASADRILTRVPPGVTGDVAIAVDAVAAASTFHALPAGSPVVLHVSATTVTAGLPLRIAGHRLGGPGASAAFVDASGGSTAARAVLARRVGVVEVPAGLAAGVYDLVITNGLGLGTGDCSPSITVVAAGTPALTSIDPAGQTPLRRVTLRGSDLRPPGLCVVEWTEQGSAPPVVLRAPGRSNGHDRVESFVPPNAQPGATYDVVVRLRSPNGPVDVGPLAYTVGTFAAPVVTAVRPAQGPAGSRFVVEGTGLLHVGARPQVALVGGAAPIACGILAAQPGFGGRPDHLLVQTPRNAADGTYGVEVTVGAQASNTNVTFTVATPALAVTAMRPDTQPASGPTMAVTLEGAGFGPPGPAAPRLVVAWADTATGAQRLGLVIFRSDTRLLVIPPGGRQNPLAVGTYTVTVTVGTQSASAPGVFTVQ